MVTTTKEDGIEVQGVVVDILPNSQFKIQVDTDKVVVGYLSGKMRKNRIKVLNGDRVTVELSPYDLEKGRITFRYK